MRRNAETGRRWALVTGSVLFSLLGLELGLRAWSGPEMLLHWPNFVLEERIDARAGVDGRLIHDSRLGWVGRPGYAAGGFSYDSRSYRTTPAATATGLTEPPLLVVGDSYAHGDEVKDDEAWPARLQSLLGRRVVNAAVTGYGLDQTVLRAEQAAADVKPVALVLGFIADDLRRSETSRAWGAEKPYFELANGTLVLRNVPVPQSPAPADTLSIWQRLFGRSLLIDYIIRRQGWYDEWTVDNHRVLPRHEGERLACPLLHRVAALGLPTLVVAEYGPLFWTAPADYARERRRLATLVLKCATEAGLATLDLHNTIDAAVRTQGLGTIYHGSHPSPAGTSLAAERIAARLVKDRIPPP